MILTETQIQQAIEQAKAAFPHLTNWQYNNEKNEEYFGFSLWGELVLDPEQMMPRRFFVTLFTDEDKWTGTLTIGQPCYLWSSADVGDAHLLYPDDYDSIEGAIVVYYRANSDLIDAEVETAIDWLIKIYSAESQGKTSS